MDTLQKVPVRPECVRMGVNLFYISIIIGFLYSMLLMFTFLPRQISVSVQAHGLTPRATEEIYDFAILYIVVALVITYFLQLFFAFKAGKGKNWARILLLIFLIINLFGFRHNLYISTANTIYIIVIYIIQILGLVFLFNKESNSWFREVKQIKK